MPINVSGGGGVSASAYRTQWVVYWDEDNDQYFLRQYTINSSDVVTATDDFELDGTTAYVASSNITATGKQYSVQSRPFRDSSQLFLRHVVYIDGTASSSFDTEVDGTTTYTVSGTVVSADQDYEFQLIERIDDNSGVATTFWRRNAYLNGALQSSTPVTATGAGYTVTGTERAPTSQYELIDTYYLDVDDSAPVDITDAKADTTGSALGSLPSNVCGAVLAVEITSTDADGLPSGFIYGKSDSGGTVGSTATPGEKIYNRQRVILGEVGQFKGDPAEVSNFTTIGDTDETAVIVVQLYRKRS